MSAGSAEPLATPDKNAANATTANNPTTA